MSQVFRETVFSDERLARIEQANDILAEYDSKLTIRQLYYQFVSRDLIPNTPQSYQKLAKLITDARYAGMIDWDSIEDRGREPAIPLQFDSLQHRVESALANYRLPRWDGQKWHVELWVEKQALAGVLAPLAREYHVTLMVNKGYSSASAMYESAQRMITASGFNSDWYKNWEDRINTDNVLAKAFKETSNYKKVMKQYTKELAENTKGVVLYYLGDHDPSGEDMVRDISDRLKEFGVQRLEVIKLALTMDQIRAFNPPPNPAKLTDSRAKAYIAKYGDKSWEVDALPPRELTRIIRRAFDQVVDVEKMKAVIARENEDKEKLREAVKALMSEEE